jgi:hypothetical protein
MHIKAREKKSMLALTGEADVHIWGRPVLDPRDQTLRLDELALDVNSEAAFGLLGAAARAALPYLERGVIERAMLDLGPLIANARKSIEAAIADFDRRESNVRIDARINELRLTGLTFDANTLRVIAEANGSVTASLSTLKLQ